MNNKIISIAVSVIVIGGGSFYAGMKYGQTGAGGRRAGGGQFRFQAGTDAGGTLQRGNRVAGGFATGEIISKDNGSVTVKLRDGGSQIIFLSDSTAVMKTVEGISADIDIGAQVTIVGTANSDGSLTAESVQIRPTQKKSN